MGPRSDSPDNDQPGLTAPCGTLTEAGSVASCLIANPMRYPRGGLWFTKPMPKITPL
jgi:hypothetical protein